MDLILRLHRKELSHDNVIPALGQISGVVRCHADSVAVSHAAVIIYSFHPSVAHIRERERERWDDKSYIDSLISQ